MLFQIRDCEERDIGSISSLVPDQPHLTGRFHPGRDFSKVESLFTQLQKAARENDKTSFDDLFETMLLIEPVVVDLSSGASTRYDAIVVSKTKRGYLVTLMDNEGSE